MTAKDGLSCVRCGTAQWHKSGHCVQCKRNRSRDWRLANPDEAKMVISLWREAHTESERERKKRWRENNPQRLRVAQRRYYVANKDSAIERTKRYRLANPERVREYSRKWREANREKLSEVACKWARANPQKANAKTNCRRTRINGGGGSYTEQEWLTLCKQYGNKCVNPHCPNHSRNEVKLTADHVVPVAMGGSSYISNIQPLCGTCNRHKGTRIVDYRNKPTARQWVQPSLLSFGD